MFTLENMLRQSPDSPARPSSDRLSCEMPTLQPSDQSLRRSPEIRRRSPDHLMRRSPDHLLRRSPDHLLRRSPDHLIRRSPEIMLRKSPEHTPTLERRSPEQLPLTFRRSPEPPSPMHHNSPDHLWFPTPIERLHGSQLSDDACKFRGRPKFKSNHF